MYNTDVYIQYMKPMQVYLEEDAKAELATLAKKRGVAMADLIREGIKAVLEESRFSAQGKMIDELAGLWADRDDIKDGISYENEIRRSSRPVEKILAETRPKYAPHRKKCR